MNSKIRRHNQSRVHQELCSLLYLIKDEDITSWFESYVIEHGFFHALSIPQKQLAYQKIEEWLYYHHPRFQKKSLQGILLLLEYPQTIDEGLAILYRTDRQLRSILRNVVPDPIANAAKKFSEFGEKKMDNPSQNDLIPLVFLLGDFETLISFLLVIQCADIIQKKSIHIDLKRFFTRASLGMKVGALNYIRDINYQATIPALQKLPQRIFTDIKKSAESMVRIRNELMHGSILDDYSEILETVAQTAWDFRLLYFCLCECQTKLQPHKSVIIKDKTFTLSTATVYYKEKPIPLWPFYVVLQTSTRNCWYLHNLSKEGKSQFILQTTDDLRDPIPTTIMALHPQIDNILSLRNISPLDLCFSGR